MLTVQPKGQDSQMPSLDCMAMEKTKASATRSTRSVMVEKVKANTAPAPRSTPSAWSFNSATT